MDERKRDMHADGVDRSIRGKGNDLKGRIKDAAGGLTGDSGLQAEGKVDRLKGKVQDTAGKIQRKIGRDDQI
jgi:uncharacterized protein YjbJ (UPF0337 family)